MANATFPVVLCASNPPLTSSSENEAGEHRPYIRRTGVTGDSRERDPYTDESTFLRAALQYSHERSNTDFMFFPSLTVRMQQLQLKIEENLLFQMLDWYRTVAPTLWAATATPLSGPTATASLPASVAACVTTLPPGPATTNLSIAPRPVVSIRVDPTPEPARYITPEEKYMNTPSHADDERAQKARLAAVTAQPSSTPPVFSGEVRLRSVTHQSFAPAIDAKDSGERDDRPRPPSPHHTPAQGQTLNSEQVRTHQKEQVRAVRKLRELIVYFQTLVVSILRLRWISEPSKLSLCL
jgi:hypothetical protein